MGIGPEVYCYWKRQVVANICWVKATRQAKSTGDGEDPVRSGTSHGINQTGCRSPETDPTNQPSITSKALKSRQAKIYIYMYHYVKNANRLEGGILLDYCPGTDYRA